MALAFLLFVVSLAVPLHLASHGATLSAHGHHECAGQGSLQSDTGHGEHRQGDEACALCQGLTRIVGILPAIPSDAWGLAKPTGAPGNPGTLHAVPAGHDFQRGPPQEELPVAQA